ncbi:MAG: hypothetical protein P8181_00995 [bacterium]
MTAFRARVLVGLILMMVTWGSGARAQDPIWWTEQSGTRAELLGGVVVGSFIDLSATYYNPGAISLVSNEEVLLSAEAIQYQSLRIKNENNPDNAQTTTRFGTAPTLFAGLFPSGWLPGRLAYSALTRQDFDVRLDARFNGNADVLAEFAGEEFYAAETYYDREMTENWFGLTWSQSPKKGFGVGATLYGAYRSKRLRVNNTAQAVAETGEGATTVIVDQFNYRTFRFLAKIGVALDYSPLQLGLALTTPSLPFLGSGEAYYNRNVTGLDLDGDGQPDSDLVVDDFEDLSAEYKSPVSVAAGASYRWERSAVHFSCEWFNGVGRYQVLDLPASLPDPDVVGTLRRRVTVELDPVFNFGLGVERRFSENYHGYASFRTDFSGASSGESVPGAPRGWDLYHVGAGAAASIKGLSLTLGVIYAFGSNTYTSKLDPETANEQNNLMGDPMEKEIAYRRLKLIVGFAFTL